MNIFLMKVLKPQTFTVYIVYIITVYILTVIPCSLLMVAGFISQIISHVLYLYYLINYFKL